jgi:hypothetical protein
MVLSGIYPAFSSVVNFPSPKNMANMQGKEKCLAPIFIQPLRLNVPLKGLLAGFPVALQWVI